MPHQKDAGLERLARAGRSETRRELAEHDEAVQVADRHVALDALGGLLAVGRRDDARREDDEVELHP
jgi:hypothetical protein